MSLQLTFDLPARSALGREDFFVSAANSHALAALDGWGTWPLGKLLLVGPEGSGKSHLAAVWAAEAGAQLLIDLPLDPPLAAHVVVDGLEAILTGGEAEQRLFHLHNHLLAQGGRLLMTSRCDVAGLAPVLPDLASRLSATSVVRIDAPDDALLAAVLVKQFSDRQLAVAPAVVSWLLARMPRDLAVLHALVARMDQVTLQRRSALSRSLAAEVLAEFQGP